jgi:hypothetical protein
MVSRGHDGRISRSSGTPMLGEEYAADPHNAGETPRGGAGDISSAGADATDDGHHCLICSGPPHKETASSQIVRGVLKRHGGQMYVRATCNHSEMEWRGSDIGLCPQYMEAFT